MFRKVLWQRFWVPINISSVQGRRLKVWAKSLKLGLQIAIRDRGGRVTHLGILETKKSAGCAGFSKAEKWS